MSESKKISIVTPCYNEEKNVRELYDQVKKIMGGQSYRYEHIFIDNASADRTVAILKEIASSDPQVKIIVNARNFGWIRSPFYGLLQAQGDAVILMASDLQDPPQLIPQLIKKWEEGFPMVLGIKSTSQESSLMYGIRSLYYKWYRSISENQVIEHCTGFGLYDQKIIKIFRSLDEPYPYLKSIIPEIGFDKAFVKYTQPSRKRGISYGNFYRLYDAAISGMTNDSRVLIRTATLFGLAASAISLLIAVAYLILKVIMWDRYPLGVASIAIGVFFFASVQLFFIGIIGEYVGAILTHVKKRPLVIEKERVNF